VDSATRLQGCAKTTFASRAASDRNAIERDHSSTIAFPSHLPFLLLSTSLSFSRIFSLSVIHLSTLHSQLPIEL